MKNLSISTYGVEEMSNEELISQNGGFIDFLYELITGRSLASDTRRFVKNAATAYSDTIREGGATCTDMPFK